MIFRRIIYTALLVGLLAGLVLSAAQFAAVNPIIFAAESYEAESHGAEGVATDHNHGSHDHGDAWAPENGIERSLYTIFANVAAGIGFAAILLALMGQLQLSGITQLSTCKGILWGIAGFIAVFIAPAIGISPELPGADAAAIERRQLWWILAVVLVAIGLLILSFAPLKYKAIGLISLVIPYIVTIPTHQGPAFTNPDPKAVEALSSLSQQFIINSAASNLLFWITLGVLASWGLNRWVLKNISGNNKVTATKNSNLNAGA